MCNTLKILCYWTNTTGMTHLKKAYLKNLPPYSSAMSHWPFNFYCIYYLRYLVGKNKRLLSNFHYNVTCSNIFFCCFVWGKSNTEALSWTSLNWVSVICRRLKVDLLVDTFHTFHTLWNWSININGTLVFFCFVTKTTPLHILFYFLLMRMQDGNNLF